MYFLNECIKFRDVSHILLHLKLKLARCGSHVFFPRKGKGDVPLTFTTLA